MSQRVAPWFYGFSLLAMAVILALSFGPPVPAQSQQIQWGQAQGVVPIQGVGAFAANSETTSASNTAATTTVTGTNRAALWKITARCSAGTASVVVKDGTTQIWSTPAAAVTTANFTEQWSTGLMSSTASLAVTLGTCGMSNTGTLDVEASAF